MSENIEFISAKDLPEAEGDEVSVLCLENGEMKQKLAKSLGGGGGYDLKVRIVAELDENEEMFPHAEILDGSFDAVKQKFDNELPALVLVIEDFMAVRDTPRKGITEQYADALYNPENFEEMVFKVGAINYDFIIMPDNSIQVMT